VIREILRYLVEHPDAKDTVEGIAKWWRSESQAEWGAAAVEESLDILVAKGWLTRRDIAPVKRVYGMNKDHLETIKNFLREVGPERVI